MNCPHCFQTVSELSAFCPHCGARLADPGVQTALEATEDPTYGALAHANLMRLRGDWEDAREKTVFVLREFPNSGTAHSLMGDVYADQQMYADAAQWYRMALDLEPLNVADTRKLAEAQRRLLADAVPPPEQEAPTRFSAYRVAAVAAMAFLIFAISLGFYVKMHSVTLLDLGPAWTKPALPPASPVTGNTPPAPSNALDGDQPPTVIDSPAPLDLAGPPAQTTRENALFTALAATALDLNVHGLRLSGVQTDPRSESATVTIDASNTIPSSAQWANTLVASATTLAQGAMRADVRLSTVTVRAVASVPETGGTTLDIVFVGEMDRAMLPLSISDTPTALTRTWWRPGLPVATPPRKDSR